MIYLRFDKYLFSVPSRLLRVDVIKITMTVLLVFLILFGWTTSFAKGRSSDAPATATTVVNGANNPLVDVAAVQAAVDQGGTVILRGTFDFGADAGNHIVVPGRTYPEQDRKGMSTVFIYQKDVTILGETGPQGELLTVIKNGYPPFYIGWDGEILRVPPPGVYGVDFGAEALNVDSQGRVNYRDTGPEPGYMGTQMRYARAFPNLSVTIKSLYFDTPRHFGIKAGACREVLVIGNVFRNVQFGLVSFLTNVTYISNGFGATSTIYAPFVRAITGKVVAERNLVDGSGTEVIDAHQGEFFGMGALAADADVRIERNEIRNIGRAMDGTGPHNLFYGAGVLLVENYGVSHAAHNFVYNSAGAGIWDFGVFEPVPGAKIEHNTLVNCVNGVDVTSLAGLRTGSLIQQNTITHDGTMGSGQTAVIAYSLSEATIKANSFEGEYAGPLVLFLGSGNSTLLENRDLRWPIPAWPQTYFLDAASSMNLIRAESGTVLDLGTNNQIFIQSPGGK